MWLLHIIRAAYICDIALEKKILMLGNLVALGIFIIDKTRAIVTSSFAILEESADAGHSIKNDEKPTKYFDTIRSFISRLLK